MLIFNAGISMWEILFIVKRTPLFTCDLVNKHQLNFNTSSRIHGRELSSALWKVIELVKRNVLETRKSTFYFSQYFR